MLVNQVSSTPPTTAASSNQMMPDGAGRLSTSFGQSRSLQMAWRLLPVFRSDIETRLARRISKRRLNYESEPELENHRWLGAARPGRRSHAPRGFGQGPRPLPA